MPVNRDQLDDNESKQTTLENENMKSSTGTKNSMAATVTQLNSMKNDIGRRNTIKIGRNHLIEELSHNTGLNLDFIPNLHKGVSF